MSDYSKLKELAEAASEGAWVQDAFDVVSDGIEDRRVARCSWLTDAQYIAAANPAAVLALIAENERLKNRLEVDPRHDYDGISTRDATVKVLDEQADQLKAENAGLKTGYEAYEQVNSELKAEVEGLRAQHVRDSAELRSLCQARDDARKERDQLKAEVEALRKDIAALKPSPIRTDKTTIGYTGCVICGQYTDHGGLQCPNLAFRSLSMEPPTKPVPPAPILMSVHGYPVDEDGKYIERKEVKP